MSEQTQKSEEKTDTQTKPKLTVDDKINKAFDSLIGLVSQKIREEGKTDLHKAILKPVGRGVKRVEDGKSNMDIPTVVKTLSSKIITNQDVRTNDVDACISVLVELYPKIRQPDPKKTKKKAESKKD